MSSESCPKTCGQLSTAAILISIGIVQLLAGIILLKADFICLLAGTDFVAATSNVFVGSMLGISASIWEKKKKVASTKKSSRQNVLAGLYIAALALNATTAIIMIMGDGNKLLTAPEESEDITSESLIFEVLACAYVTSVCSPIVCLVIAIVCLSGNRIQVQDRMKQTHSITKSESYGWVYDKNVGVRPKNLEELLMQFSANKQSPVSDDNVFLEKKSTLGKPSSGKKTKPNSRNSISSVREVLTPLEIWAQKRKKILQEITTPKPMFFSDDYLQFPDFKYGSYAETMIPRIKSSLQKMDQNSASTPHSEESYVSNMHKAGKTMSCNPAMVNVDELNVKLAARRMSYPDCLSNMNVVDADSSGNNAKETNGIPYDCKLPNRFSVDGVDLLESPELRNSLETLTRMNENLTSGTQPVAERKVDVGHDTIDSFSNEYTFKQERLSSEYSKEIPRKDSTRSVSGLTSETICELKAKINRLSMNDRSNSEHKREFMGSFKSGNTRKSNLSESDINCIQSRAINSISSEGGQSNSTSWAGDVVPISIQPSENRSNVSFKEIQNFTSPNEDSIKTSNQNIADRLKSPTSEDVLFERATPPFRSLKEKPTRNSPFENSKCSSVKHSERKFDFTRPPIMGSIAESPTEEGIQRHQQNFIQPRESAVAIDQSRETTPKATNENSLHSTQKRSSKASPNISPKSLLNRLWSIKRSEIKELSTLVMDTDSLVGLSDEQLLDRTLRMRLIRKSVILRSKDENRRETETQENGSS